MRQATVYAKASSASDAVGQIAAGALVSVFERQGGWELIFSDQSALTGWVRSYQVRVGDYSPTPETQSEPDSRGFLSGLAAFSRRASGFFGDNQTQTGSRTATIGIRGLSEAELKAAQPDLEELKRMQGYASDATRIAAFSSEGKLQARKLAHIPQTRRK